MQRSTTMNAFTFKARPRRPQSSSRLMSLGELDSSDIQSNSSRSCLANLDMSCSGRTMSRSRTALDMSGSGRSRRRMDQQLFLARRCTMMKQQQQNAVWPTLPAAAASLPPIAGLEETDLGYKTTSEGEEEEEAPKFITFRRRKSNARRSTMGF